MTLAAVPSAAPGGAAMVPAIVALAGQLAGLLERETGLVRALKIAEIAPLQSEKARLTNLFQKALKQLGSPTQLPAAAKSQWLLAGRRLADAAVENERALRAGRAATERLIAAIVNAVKLSRRPLTVYAPRRNISSEPRIAGVALDRRL
ncbi:MAG TPA: hypothetical protein VN802_07860 [Stellaceae bacterium]|nr:hypothetical protein [Stellaceae bacterium]